MKYIALVLLLIVSFSAQATPAKNIKPTENEKMCSNIADLYGAAAQDRENKLPLEYVVKRLRANTSFDAETMNSMILSVVAVYTNPYYLSMTADELPSRVFVNCLDRVTVNKRSYY